MTDENSWGGFYKLFDPSTINLLDLQVANYQLVFPYFISNWIVRRSNNGTIIVVPACSSRGVGRQNRCCTRWTWAPGTWSSTGNTATSRTTCWEAFWSSRCWTSSAPWPPVLSYSGLRTFWRINFTWRSSRSSYPVSPESLLPGAHSSVKFLFYIFFFLVVFSPFPPILKDRECFSWPSLEPSPNCLSRDFPVFWRFSFWRSYAYSHRLVHTSCITDA